MDENEGVTGQGMAFSWKRINNVSEWKSYRFAAYLPPPNSYPSAVLEFQASGAEETTIVTFPLAALVRGLQITENDIAGKQISELAEAHQRIWEHQMQVTAHLRVIGKLLIDTGIVKENDYEAKVAATLSELDRNAETLRRALSPE